MPSSKTNPAGSPAPGSAAAVQPQVSLQTGPAKTYSDSPLTFYSNKFEVKISTYDVSIIFSEEAGGGNFGKEQEIRARIVLPHVVSAQLMGQLVFTTRLLEKLYGGRIPTLLNAGDTPEKAVNVMRIAMQAVQQEMADELANANAPAADAGGSKTMTASDEG